jgi:ribosomal protein S18 acetylase RimI-like enzyme
MADVREARIEDVPRVAETLASAFSGDPVFSWMTPERVRERRMRPFFSRLVRDAMKRGSVFTSDDCRCASVWFPPDQWKVPVGQLVRSTPVMVRTFGTRTPRAFGALSSLESKHPKDAPHWYLEFLGTRRDCQRTGIGSKVLGFMLERCDQEAIPAYLEASSPENVPFYLRHGFEVQEEVALKGGPSLWRMWREPK